MKVLILNNGFYGTTKEVNFPVEVDIPDECYQGCYSGKLSGGNVGRLVSIPPETLVEVGIKQDSNKGYQNFYVGSEVEILEGPTL